MVEALMLYSTPVLAAVLFVICVSIHKRIVKNKDTENLTGAGAIIFAVIVFNLLYFSAIK
ncbi:hypothetical protein G5B47_21670 [Paenibacillus sp. 7124]|uniref:Uncharacterized protein n=1 Tax=Paenibacillus apii TaxID=1850370 RepID=A0A6M1PTJ4_9BACL|nr:hypothetical protein [Paenibacillus apii]NGM85013.1 hypothetical protein [Paenibacillus apii]NJJ38527.1 hypothetical protein [Paenibacillus apii]